MTSSRTAPLHTNGHRPAGNSHPLAGMASVPAWRANRHPFNPARVQYGRGWLGVGAGIFALGIIGLRQYGYRAGVGYGLAGLASLAYMTMVEPARPTLERITLRLPDLPPALDGLRIGQLTDCHLGMPHSAKNLAWAVEQMRREQPDLITLTGDFVSRRAAIPQLSGLLRGLSAPLGIYGVPGNHDYWEGLPEINAELGTVGGQILVNENRRLSWNGADLWLLAVDDMWDGHPDLDAAMTGVPRGACTFLMAHSPDIADAAAQHGVSAQISGHTHGGHIRFPLLGPLALPRFGWRYAMGQYTVGKMQLYVSRGLGGGPFRLLCAPEATIFTLRRS